MGGMRGHEGDEGRKMRNEKLPCGVWRYIYIHASSFTLHSSFSQVSADVPGMVFEDGFAQHAAVDVRIDFGRPDGLVAEHQLDGAEVGPTLEQMGGEGMAERVRADGLPHAGQLD